MSYDKDKIAALVRSARIAKGYTQLELSERTKISLRSIQRIENGGVEPRLYTLKLLSGQLDFDPDLALAAAPPDAEPPVPVHTSKNDRTRRRILSVGLGLVLLIACVAFLSQTRSFPETNFEALCFWGAVLLGYTLLLWRIWK